MTVKKDLIKDRLDRLEGREEDIEESKKQDIKKPKNRDVGISERVANEPPRFRQVRELIASGKSTNYYLSKDGEIIQRVLIHIPFELAEKLKSQAY